MSFTTEKFHRLCINFWGGFEKRAQKVQESKPIDPQVWLHAKYVARPDLLREELPNNPHFAEAFQDIIQANPEEFSGGAPIDQANQRGQAAQDTEDQQMIADNNSVKTEGPEFGVSPEEEGTTEAAVPKEGPSPSDKGKVNITIKNGDTGKKTAGIKTDLTEVVGLGALAIPSIRGTMGKKTSKKMERALEIGGLGILATPSLANLGKKFLKRG